jgi:hypothetical protein
MEICLELQGAMKSGDARKHQDVRQKGRNRKMEKTAQFLPLLKYY